MKIQEIQLKSRHHNEGTTPSWNTPKFMSVHYSGKNTTSYASYCANKMQKTKSSPSQLSAIKYWSGGITIVSPKSLTACQKMINLPKIVDYSHYSCCRCPAKSRDDNRVGRNRFSKNQIRTQLIQPTRTRTCENPNPTGFIRVRVTRNPKKKMLVQKSMSLKFLQFPCSRFLVTCIKTNEDQTHWPLHTSTNDYMSTFAENNSHNGTSKFKI